MPAGIAVIEQVKSVWLAPTPAAAPVNEVQLFAPAVPEIVQVIVPPGAVAPTTPETVAV